MPTASHTAVMCGNNHFHPIGISRGGVSRREPAHAMGTAMAAARHHPGTDGAARETGDGNSGTNKGHSSGRMDTVRDDRMAISNLHSANNQTRYK